MAAAVFLRVSLPFAGMAFLNQAARMVVATAGPAVATSFGLSASELGGLGALFFAAYALAQLPVGLAIDLYGPRRVQIGLALVAALGFLICATAADPLQLGVGRFVTGLGIAGALIGLMKANALWFPRHRLAATTGAGVFIGAAGSLAASAPLQAILPMIGWRGAFLLLAALAVMVAAWIWFSVPRQAPGPPPPPRQPLSQEIAEFGRIFRHPVFLRYAPAVALLSSLVFAYQGLWAGPWLRDVAGLGGQDRAFVLLFFSLGVMLGQLLGGQLASWLQPRGIAPMLVPFVGMGLMAVSQVLLILAPGDLWALCLLWFVFAYAGSCGPVAYALLSHRFPTKLTGRVTTAINFTMLATVFVLQIVIGWILDLLPRTAAGGWNSVGYGWALGLTLALQALSVLWMLRAPLPDEGKPAHVGE
jgi:MFS family permease